MSRADYSARPIQGFTDPNGNVFYPDGGLTIREHTIIEMAKAILTGAVARGCPAREWTDNGMAVKCADALIAEMAKPVTP